MFWLVHNSLVHVDVLDCEGSTALYNALVDANYGAMEALCLLGANLEWVGEDQYTYLQTAVADEDVKAVEILTDYEADIYSLGEVMLRQIKFSFSYCGLRKFAQKTASKILNPDFNIDNVEVINLHDDKLLALLVKSYGNQKKAKKKHLFKHRTKAMVKEFMSDEKLRTEKIAAIRAS